MKKFLIVALIGLSATLSATAFPSKEKTLISEPVTKFELNSKLNDQPILITDNQSFDFDAASILSDAPDSGSILFVENPFSFITFKTFDTFHPKESPVMRLKDNRYSNKITSKTDNISNKAVFENQYSMNLRTNWSSYQEYLKQTSWRLNVKHIRYEQLFGPASLKT